MTDTQSRIVEALEIGLDSVRAELEQARQAFKGYPKEYAHLEREIEKVEAALAEARQQPPEGWVMVPREKLEQLSQGIYSKLHNAKENGDKYDIGYFGAMLNDVDAMLSAAPPQPAASEGPFGWVLITGQGEVFRRAKPDCLIDRWVPVWSAPQPAPPAGEPVAWMWNRGGVEFRTQPPPDYTAWQWTPLYTAQPDARDAKDALIRAAENALHYMRLHKYADQAWADDLEAAIAASKAQQGGGGDAS